MSTKKRTLFFFGLILLLLPEVLYSPTLVLLYSIFSHGKILRESYFTQAGSQFIYLVLFAQIIGVLILIKIEKMAIWKNIFSAIFSLLIITAILIYGLSGLGL